MLLFVLFWWFGVLTQVVGGSGLPRVVWLARVSVLICVWFWLLSLCFWVVGIFVGGLI